MLVFMYTEIYNPTAGHLQEHNGKTNDAWYI